MNRVGIQSTNLFKMKNLIFVAGMLCLITMFSCEKPALKSDLSEIRIPIEQVHWDDFPEDVKRVLAESNSVDQQESGEYRTCFGIQPIITSAVGGNGGQPFTLKADSRCDVISHFYVRSGIFIDAIFIIYKRQDGSFYARTTGGTGGTWQVITFGINEYIRTVEARSGTFVDALRIETSEQIHWFGGNGGTLSVVYPGASNRAVLGFHGRSGVFIDKIGVIAEYR